MDKPILMPKGGSKWSEEALKQELAFAKELGAEVTFLLARALELTHTHF